VPHHLHHGRCKRGDRGGDRAGQHVHIRGERGRGGGGAFGGVWEVSFWGAGHRPPNTLQHPSLRSTTYPCPTQPHPSPNGLPPP
jgi:hypothetical protein